MRKIVFKFLSFGLVLGSMFLVGCGDSSHDSLQKSHDTTKSIRAVADDETDWTWFVDTEAAIKNNKLTIESYYGENIPSEVKHLQYFIDIDNRGNTGFSFGRDSWRISGADYLVEDGALYKSNSKTKWDWSYVGAFDSYTQTSSKVVMSGSSILEGILEERENTKMPINVTIEPFDLDWGSTYSTISTQAVVVEGSTSNRPTMILDPKRVDAHINIHDNTPAGAYFTYEEDTHVPVGQHVLALHSAGIQNSFHILGYETDIKYNWFMLPSHQNRHQVSWDSKFSEDFIIYVVLKFKTLEGKTIWSDLVYTPSQNGYADYTDNFMHISLGASAKDGTWKHFERDVLADLQLFYPGATIDYDDNYAGYVNGFAVRGNGRITNIKLSRN